MNSVKIANSESVKPASGRSLRRARRPSGRRSAVELENCLLQTARTRPSRRNSLAALSLETQRGRFLCFWAEYGLDMTANWREVRCWPFANQAANPRAYPTAWLRRSRARQAWLRFCSSSWTFAPDLGAYRLISTSLPHPREQLPRIYAEKIQSL